MLPSSALRFAKLALAAGLVAVIVVVVASGGSSGHTVQVVVPEATGVIPGERVVAGGNTVGSISSATVTRDGKAHLVMQIDDSAWPLPRDTVLRLRMGGTIKYTDRFVDVARGHDSAMFSPGDYIPAKQFVVPVEYDTLFNTFDRSTRAGLTSFLDNAGPALSTASPSFRQALGNSAPALAQVDAVFRDLGYDKAALRTLVNSTDNVVNAVGRSNPGIQQLLQGAANTFTAVANQSQALQTAISNAPQSFQNAGHALFHLADTLDHAATLSDRLNPGVTQLRALAAPLNNVLGTVVGVAPDAISTLRTVRDAAPSLDSLLTKASSPLMPRLQTIGKTLARQLDCVRPYTPEIVGTLSTWGAFWGLGDYKDTVLHGALGPTAMTNANLTDSATLGKVLPGLAINFPAVPGSIVNQPWYQPQCGITADSFNLAKDPEAHTLDPLGAKIVPYP
jgi:phospholipid/cholesterol/gamma-HCH transport system substrate-binding protein